MPLSIVRNDITTMTVDAIVNAANSKLQKGNGVCYDIFMASGEMEMQDACENLGPLDAGNVALTPGFNLPSRYVIHAVGPMWRNGEHGEKQLLATCYEKALDIALEKQITSIAFPLISTGSLGYPKHEAMHVAVSTITDFLSAHDMSIYLVVHDEDSYLLSKTLYTDIKSYIDTCSVEQQFIRSGELLDQSRIPCLMQNPIVRHDRQSDVSYNRNLRDTVEELEESFTRRLFRIIAERSLDEVQVYKKANIDRKHFSKIRSNDAYQPSKETAIALAIALELDVEEAKDLIGRAGYILSRSHTFDMIIEYFITQRKHNIHEINEALFTFDQPLLGV
jgi:O-acetyl-ADP-ribose deacetylase